MSILLWDLIIMLIFVGLKFTLYFILFFRTYSRCPKNMSFTSYLFILHNTELIKLNIHFRDTVYLRIFCKYIKDAKDTWNIESKNFEIKSDKFFKQSFYKKSTKSLFVNLHFFKACWEKYTTDIYFLILLKIITRQFLFLFLTRCC